MTSTLPARSLAPMGGCLGRPWTNDGYVADEVVRCYGWMLRERESAVVMDCGGHAGFFTRYALDHGASRVVTYEPNTENFELLAENVGSDPRVELHNAALVDDDRGLVELYLNPGKSKSWHSIRPVKRRTEKEVVKALNFQRELDRVRPDVLKVDVEGAEHYFLGEAVIPGSVRVMTIEFDARGSYRDVPFREHAVMLIKRLEDQGFWTKHEDVRKLTSTGKWAVPVRFARA